MQCDVGFGERTFAAADPAAVIMGIMVIVVLVADKRSLQCLKTGDVVVPPVKGAQARFLWVPKWAFRVSRAAACVVVPGLIPETSMATWQDACDPTRAGVAGAGAMCADDHGVGATRAGLYQGAGCGAAGQGIGYDVWVCPARFGGSGEGGGLP